MKVIRTGNERGVYLTPQIIGAKKEKDLIIWNEDKEGLSLGDGSSSSYRLNHTEIAQIIKVLQSYLDTGSILGTTQADEFKGNQAESLVDMVAKLGKQSKELLASFQR